MERRASPPDERARGARRSNLLLAAFDRAEYKSDQRMCGRCAAPPTSSPTPDACALYRRKLTLIRPDQHVAWRGDEEPVAALELMDLVRGAGEIDRDAGLTSSMRGFLPDQLKPEDDPA